MSNWQKNIARANDKKGTHAGPALFGDGKEVG